MAASRRRRLPCSPWLAALVLCGACDPGNELPPPGRCDANTIAAPQVERVRLVDGAASFDDLVHLAALDRVLAIPQGRGAVHLIEPVALDVTTIDGLPTGIASGDGDASTLWLADRSAHRIVGVAIDGGDVIATIELSARPDYVRLRPASGELWVSLPGEHRMAVLDVAAVPPVEIDSVAVDGGPEGLTFSPDGARAYAQVFVGAVVVIDTDARREISRWDSGCVGAHGFPQIDAARGLLVAGCQQDGGIVVLDEHGGARLAGFSAGGGESILAADAERERLYVRGDPDGALAMLAVCDGGTVHELARVDVGAQGHGMTVDAHGGVWVCDADGGGVVRVLERAR